MLLVSSESEAYLHEIFEQVVEVGGDSHVWQSR